MKKIAQAFLMLLVVTPCYSQENNILKDENLLIEELKKDKYEVDSNAQAVILYRKVSADIYQGIYSYSVDFIAKILSDDAAMELSKIDIPRYNHTSVVGISGETFNLENGAVVKQELAKNEIMKDKYTEGVDILKFNLPSVKKGSIIHYTYKTNQPNFISIPDHYLQMEYPILFESYDLSIPTYLTCKKIERVNTLLKQVKFENELDNCDACVFDAEYGGNQNSYYKWVRRNVPAFKDEPQMGSGKNYKERIKMQVTYVKFNGVEHEYLNNWDNYEKAFVYSNNNFVGQVFKGNGFLSDVVSSLTKGKTTEMDKAKAIYVYIRDSFSIKYTGKDFSLRTIFNDKVGSENEINLLLVAMLRKADLKCAPLFLSPKPNEKLNPVFPDDRNSSVILADLQIDKKDIYLDASKKHLPFGIVLPENYNGYARVVNEQGKGIDLDPNLISEKSTTICTIKPGNKPTQLVLSMDSKLGAFEAYDFRKAMNNDTIEIKKALTKGLKEKNSVFNLTGLKVDNLQNPDAALKIHVDATWDLDEKTTTIYFNPFIDKFFDKSPFTSNQRTYPIEMDYRDDKTYIFNINLPTGYVIDDYPKSTSYKLGTEGNILVQNQYSYDEPSNTLSIKSVFQTKECTFPVEQYESIKSMYDKCVEAQNEKIVIKKTDLK